MEESGIDCSASVPLFVYKDLLQYASYRTKCLLIYLAGTLFGTNLT